MDATEIPSSTTSIVELCDKSECIRTRALLARRPPVEYRPLEEVRFRTGHISWIWLSTVVIAVAWTVACIQKDRPVLGIINFVLAFLPLWRQLYVDTAWRWSVVAWIVMVATFYAL